MDAGAEHVVVVAHDDAVERVDHRALVALDVEHGAGRILLVVAVLILAVVGDGQERPAKRVEMRDGRRVRMRGGLLRRALLVGAQSRR